MKLLWKFIFWLNGLKYYPIVGGRPGAKSKAAGGISEAGATMYEAGKMKPYEETQYAGSFDLGNLIKQLQLYQMGLGTAPTGYIDPTQQYLLESGALGKTLYEQTLTEAQDPYAYYESTLRPQLELTQDYINRQAQGRGLIRSGIPIEQMGRAGVELAIKEAEARQQARANALQRAAGLTEYISGQQANRLIGLSNLYGQQQQFGLSALGRQAGQAQAAAQYQAYPYQAMLGDIYGRRAALYALPGQLIGAAGQTAGAAAGAAAAGAAAACWIAKEIFGSWEHPKTILARYYINNLAPKWFKNFYLEYGENIAKFISNKPILKSMIRPLFEIFAYLGNIKSEVIYGAC